MPINRLGRVVVAMAIVVAIVALAIWVAFSRSTTGGQDQRRYSIGIVTWIGYAPLFIAQDKGFFKSAGIDVDIKILDGAGEREAAYVAGQLDFLPNTPDALAIFAARGVTGKLIMVMDESFGADGLVARRTIPDVASLKGKTVGFQSGITSHFFLLYLLNKVGLTGRDIVQQNLNAGDAGAAFVAGHLDAAVTWEPWLTKARERPDGHVLMTSKDTPGLLADVLLVQDRVLEHNRGDVLAFVRVWYRAVDYMKSHPEDSISITAKALKVSVADASAMLQSVRFYTVSEAKQYFGTSERPGPLADVFGVAARLYKENGVIERVPNIGPLLDASVLHDVHTQD